MQRWTEQEATYHDMKKQVTRTWEYMLYVSILAQTGVYLIKVNFLNYCASFAIASVLALAQQSFICIHDHKVYTLLLTSYQPGAT